MDPVDFRKSAYEIIDFIVEYYQSIHEYPVKSRSKPGEILAQLKKQAPEDPESIQSIMEDFRRIILPGITHWQSPGFHAYFTANGSFPSILGDLLSSALGVQGMIWETSPAATELEERMMQWLRDFCGLPSDFEGVIQDAGSTANLVALLSAREKKSNYIINQDGFTHNKYRVYCSSEAHSSIEKAAKIAGFGKNSVVKIPVDDGLAMIPEELEKAIIQDLEQGAIPCCVVAALGTTGTCAVDPLKEISFLTNKYEAWLHIDAAWAGSALVLEKERWMIEGIENADSFVFNPHKWMFTNFDCSAYFVKNKEELVKTFSITPEYLKSNRDKEVNNYRDWGIQLGRRFRSLKLWFVLREMGLKEIRKKIENHIYWAEEIAAKARSNPNIWLFEPQRLALVVFALCPKGMDNPDRLNELNKDFLDHLNASGVIYLSHTKVENRFVLRMVTAQTLLTREKVMYDWDYIEKESVKFINQYL